MAYLVHHGILGQKWGVRRYQDDDGSLTAAGEQRYYSEAGKRRFSFGDAKEKITSRVNKAVNAVKSIKDRKAQGSQKSEKDSKRTPMSSEKKKALAKKILIGAGAVAITAAAAYGAKKGMNSYANKLLSQAETKSVSSFAEQSLKAHTKTSKFLWKTKSSTDFNQVRKEVEAYQKHVNKGMKDVIGKRKSFGESYQIIKNFRKKPVKIDYNAALEMLRRRGG